MIYNNLPDILASDSGGVETRESSPAAEDRLIKMALEIDEAMHEHAPAGFRGDSAREAQVLNALFPIMNRDRGATSALFELIKNMPGYE